MLTTGFSTKASMCTMLDDGAGVGAESETYTVYPYIKHTHIHTHIQPARSTTVVG